MRVPKPHKGPREQLDGKQRAHAEESECWRDPDKRGRRSSSPDRSGAGIGGGIGASLEQQPSSEGRRLLRSVRATHYCTAQQLLTWISLVRIEHKLLNRRYRTVVLDA